MTKRLLTLTLLAGATLALACRTDTPAPPPTLTLTATPIATASPTPAGIPAQSVRDVDWASPAVLDGIRRHFNGGEIEPKRVAYADLTGDGKEEALVVVESGGTAGDLGAVVYEAAAGRVSILAWIDRAGHIELRLANVGPPNASPAAALIVVQQGIYAPGDANCCPSRIREIVLRWDGSAFLIFGDQTIPAPQ